jgi:CRISPR/Cas system-associated endoribonuclease Cas2
MAGRKNEIAMNVLKVVGAVSLLGIAVVAPNVLLSLKVFGLDPKSQARKKYYINNTIGRLLKSGHIKLVKKGKKKFFKLTKKGKKELDRFQLQDFKIKKPKKWDGKWRVVIFDIKEFMRKERNQLRATLKKIGFKMLQNSVWVCPYDCKDFIFLLKTNYSLGLDVLYLEVEKIENDKWLKKDFRI